MTHWKEISQQQNLELSRELLERQGQINGLKQQLTEAEADRQSLQQRLGEALEELEQQRDDIERAREVMDSDAYRLATGETCMPGQTASCGDFHNGGHCVRPRVDAELADINARMAVDKRVLDAAEVLVARMKQAVGDSAFSASQWLDPDSYALYVAVDARRALTGEQTGGA